MRGERIVERAASAGFWLLLVTLALHEIHAYDIWWQIATGEWILGHGIPRIDPFSYAFPGREWIEPRWLFCLAAHAIFRTLGVAGLILAKLSALGAAFWALSRSGTPGVRWATLVGLCVALLAAHGRFLVRPELVSFAGLTLTLLSVERFRRGGSVRWLAVLPVLQLVWCNAHTLWILGPAVIWIVVCGELAASRLGRAGLPGPRLRRLALAGAVSSAVTLVNPYLLRGVAFPLRLFTEISGEHYLSDAIVEFVGPFSDHALASGWRATTLVIAALVSAAALALNFRRTPLSRAALWLAFLMLALEAQRNVALFGLVAGFTTAAGFGEWFAAGERRRLAGLPRAVLAGIAALCLIAVPLVATDRFYRAIDSTKRFGIGVSRHKFPVRAMAFLRQHGLNGRVLHALGDGGYVLFDRGPQSVFADGRLEVYDEPILRQAIGLASWGPAIDERARVLALETVLLPNQPAYGALLTHLATSPGWAMVYYDSLHQVFLALDPGNRELARRLQRDAGRPVARPPALAWRWPPAGWPRVGDGFEDERLGSFFVGIGDYDGAMASFERAVAADPGDERACLFLGLFYRATGRAQEADALLRRVPPSFLERAEVMILAGQIHLWAGDPAAAVEQFARAVRAGAPEPGTSTRLARAAIASEDAQRARATLERLAAGYPEHVDGWNLLGALALQQGDPQEATRYFLRSLEIHPDQPRVRAQLRSLRAGPQEPVP